jgi:CRISPR-associated protein Cas5d
VTTFCLEVEGDLACFTRPEMKAERVSYDVITPSAARAIFEAILWKPAIDWEVERIEVLRPIRWLTIRRNEVASKVPVASVRAAMRAGVGRLALDVDGDRQQRGSLLLREVAYRLHARLVTGRNATGEPLAKYEEIFRRRAAHGQCVTQPYLGCREFACRFRLVDDPAQGPAVLDETRDLGLMLFDLDYTDPERPAPIWFRARMEHGSIAIPKRTSPELLR